MNNALLIARRELSAYVRSCIFDAESLRAQVKEALAQMHAASEPTPPTSSEEKGLARERGRFRFLSRWSLRQTED